MSGTQDNFGKILPMEVDKEYQFEGFKVVFIGRTVIEQAPKNKVRNIDTFLVHAENDEEEQVIEIQSGEEPPQPAVFSVWENEFTIYTHQLHDGTELCSKYFVIVKS